MTDLSSYFLANGLMQLNTGHENCGCGSCVADSSSVGAGLDLALWRSGLLGRIP
jgi:hypothetical protein